ncbi:MAG: hypothetical protein IK020_13080 [Clostridiales bacterium]|nr:hypothetical protein [Clostridiales bacterium]
MENSVLIIRTIVMLAGLIGAIVLLFVGFRGTNRELKKDDASHTVPRDVLIRSTLLLLCAVLCVVISYVAMHYPEYQEGNCTLSELVLVCFLSVAKSLGWIVAIPWLMNLFRKTARR